MTTNPTKTGLRSLERQSYATTSDGVVVVNVQDIVAIPTTSVQGSHSFSESGLHTFSATPLRKGITFKTHADNTEDILINGEFPLGAAESIFLDGSVLNMWNLTCSDSGSVVYWVGG